MNIINKLLFILVILQLATASSSSSSSNNSKQFRSNPYDILGVDATLCTEKDIQRQYRKLCLKHHPDKKRNDDNISSASVKGVDDDDFEFKEIQHAYSLIGTKEDRRKYDLMRKFNLHSPNHDAFSSYATRNTSNRFGQHQQHEDMNNMFGHSSNIYFTFGGRNFVFQTGGGTNRHHPYNYMPFSSTNFYRRRHQRYGEMSSENKPHYIQKISVPLDVLYAGGETVDLTLKTSILNRYVAAFRGGVLKPVLMQSALTVVLTWLRSQKINWFLSLFLFISLTHIHLPNPPTKVVYTTSIKKGWKGGTKVNYNTSDANVTFIIQESSNNTSYSRVGNDLHTRVDVSKRQLRRGCTLTIPPLCSSDGPIKLKLKRNQVRDGETVTIKSRGWPITGHINSYGDLKVKICCRT